ncbi:methyltransferase type 11 [Bryobacterales bacterium F-183]|nr:methyltransferase type 11 [Bryobacterales bacterium F-183]
MSSNSLIRRLWAVAVAATVFTVAQPRQENVHPVTGRKYAQVMGYGGADWLERPEREWEENPGKALDVLGLKKGMVVADVGAGTGYFSVRMARKVGPEGKVYASDLQEPMLQRLARNMAREKIKNVEPVLATEMDPNLPANAIDLILMVDVYHEFSYPQEMLRKMRAALRPDGRLVLLEYRKEDPSIPIRPEHKMSVKEVKAELEAEGFRLKENIGILPRQHILIFTKATS